MKLYEELLMGDLLVPIEGLLKSGALRLTPEGLIEMNNMVEVNRPWINAMYCPERDCTKWLGIYFKYYQIIPKGCRNCWKVAFHPKTLEDTFKVLKIQEEMNMPSKSGIENRGRTGHLGGYSSFWYCPFKGGLAWGRTLFQEIKNKLEAELGYSDGLILKRGCTEIEHFFLAKTGKGSDVWDLMAEPFDHTEQLLETVFQEPKNLAVHDSILYKNHIKKMWIESAFEHGDKTYLKYTEMESFVPPLVNYMLEKNLTKKIDITWEDKNDSDKSISSLV